MYTLRNWSLVSDGCPYIPPESRKIFLSGEVYGHEKKDGSIIKTSYIVDVSGDLVITRSGSIYKLENPSEDYINYCKKNNLHIPTEKEPIKKLNL